MNHSYNIALRWVTEKGSGGDWKSLHFERSRIWHGKTLIGVHYGSCALVRSQKLPRKTEQLRRMVLVACEVNNLPAFTVRKPTQQTPKDVEDYRIRLEQLAYRLKRTKFVGILIDDMKKLVREANAFCVTFGFSERFDFNKLVDEKRIRAMALAREERKRFQG